MQHSEATFKTASGGELYCQYWVPATSVRAVIVLVHGAAEHSARYEHVARFFTARGFVVAAFDLPGHGRSGGLRGFIPDFNDYLEALGEFRQRLAVDFKNISQVLLGHSMGGLISARYLLDYQDGIAACVLSGPLIRSEQQPGSVLLRLLRLLSVILPKLGVLSLDSSGVSRNPQEVQRYRDDPLVFTGKLRARMVAELFRAMSAVEAGARSLRLPMLILHGGSDSISSPRGSRFLYEQVSSQHKRLEIYPGLYHEIFNEPEREQVFTDILKWLESCGI
jgi:alpha-beta hydrolase superfamily lysophospholipase